MGAIKIDLEVDDINLILEALGQLPFVRVYRLIGHIQAQAAAQIEGPSAAPAERPHLPGDGQA